MIALFRLDWRRRGRSQPQFEHIIVAATTKQAAQAAAHHRPHAHSRHGLYVHGIGRLGASRFLGRAGNDRQSGGKDGN